MVTVVGLKLVTVIKFNARSILQTMTHLLIQGNLDALNLYVLFRRRPGQKVEQAREAATSWFGRRPPAGDTSLLSTKRLAKCKSGDGRHDIPCLHKNQLGLDELEALWPFLDEKADGVWKNAELKAQIERLIQVRLFFIPPLTPSSVLP